MNYKSGAVFYMVVNRGNLGDIKAVSKVLQCILFGEDNDETSLYVFKELPSDKVNCCFGEGGFMITYCDGIDNGGHWP